MGFKWHCDQCGRDLSQHNAVPAAIGVPVPEPINIMGPMGQALQVVQGPNGSLIPYKKDPDHIFENFQFCTGCALALAVLLKKRASKIKCVIRVDRTTDA